MRNSTNISWKNKFLMGWISSMILGLIMGCSHHPVVKPMAENFSKGGEQEAIAYCQAKTTLSLQETLDLINQSQETFGNAGREAGSMSDLVTKADNSTGAQAGKSVGKVIGLIGALGALYQSGQAEDQRFQACLSEKGYLVSGY
ncbi:hypothetical protein [Candidatus Nitrospira allomarina]|uniref:Lipoprotein n=1 Tax=Candidatus Nitrospira allomarina TaxID=3020900 RepID=A0AA96GHL0_9BACT|nr:hypothetical protein [Candidatus Nitrospira allomarina]WNM57851.1 hypothetical protein PP769_18050 [Candidatus Nitrospira allomarina]